MLKKTSQVLLIIGVLIGNLYVPEFKTKAITLGEVKKELASYEEKYKNNQLEQNLSEKEKKQIEANIVSISRSIENATTEMANLTKEIEVLNENILAKEKEIAEIINFAQISNGEPAYLQYAFGAKDFTDFIYRVSVSEQLTSYNNSLVEAYKQDIQNNKDKKKSLEEKKVSLRNQQQNLSVELEKVRGILSELDEENFTIEQEIAARKSTIKVYTDRGCKDNEDIAVCGLNILPPDTKFLRPVISGYVSSLYGKRDCSKPQVSCYHTGVDMSNDNANYGNVPIYPAANGIVTVVIGLKVNPATGRYELNQCSGRQILIEHNVNGKLYTTRYKHLRRVDVKEGDVVTKDTQLGIMGGNPELEYYDNCSTGAHLHFEISTGKYGDKYSSYEALRVNPDVYLNYPGYVGGRFSNRYQKF